MAQRLAQRLAPGPGLAWPPPTKSRRSRWRLCIQQLLQQNLANSSTLDPGKSPTSFKSDVLVGNQRLNLRYETTIIEHSNIPPFNKQLSRCQTTDEFLKNNKLEEYFDRCFLQHRLFVMFSWHPGIIKVCSVLEESHIGANSDFEIWAFKGFFSLDPKKGPKESL